MNERETTYTSRTRLWIDHTAQLLRRERVWTRPDGPEPLDPRADLSTVLSGDRLHLVARRRNDAARLHPEIPPEGP